MYICGDGHIFQEPATVLEWDDGHRSLGCPICGVGFDEILEEGEYDEEWVFKL